MASDDLSKLAWLDELQDEESDVGELQVGVEFSSGFTGQWTCKSLYSAWVETGVNLESLGVEYLAKNEIQGKGSFLYYETYAQGMEAKEKLGQQYPPRQVWRWEMPTSTIINWHGGDVKETLGDSLGYDVNIIGPKSKNRVPFHMLTLPSALQAMALSSGIIDEPVYDYESLTNKIPENVTEEIEEQFVGTSSGYTQSELWRAREALWQQLGEENSLAYMRFGTGTEYDATKQNSVFDKMLNVVYRSTVMWGRLTRVPEPRVDAVVKSSGNHLYSPVIVALYKNKEDAVEAEGSGSDTPETGGGSVIGLVLPGAWVEGNASESDWIDFVVEFTEPLGSSKMVLKKKLEDRKEELENYGCTSKEVLEAWEAINK